MSRASAGVAAALASLLVVGSSGATIPGRWLVTFEEGSAVRVSLENASPEAYPAKLGAAVADLSDAVGVPLRAGAAIGGGTWTVHADGEGIVRLLEDRARRVAGIAGVERGPTRDAGVFAVPGDRTLVVSLSSESARAALEKAFGPRLPVRLEPRAGAVSVSVRWTALTDAVAQALRELPAVRSVEVDTIAEPNEWRVGVPSPAAPERDSFGCGCPPAEQLQESLARGITRLS